MSPFRRKAVENALVAVLRGVPAAGPRTTKVLRARVAEMLGDACSPAELAATVLSLRYRGKLEWDRLALSESMKLAAEVEPALAAASASADVPSTAAGPDDEDDEDYPGAVNDRAVEQPVARPAHNLEDRPASRSEGRAAAADGSSPAPATGPSGGFVARSSPRKGSIRGASTRASTRPLPPPRHESELARLVREECNERARRRALARSTGTVRTPVELKPVGPAGLSFAEGVAALLAETPADVMLAIRRKHPQLWRRVILVGRRAEKRSAEALYWALEAGLDAIEAELPPQLLEVSDAA